MIKLYSKRFESRKDGIAELKKKMQKMSTSQAQNNFDCIISIVSKLLKDQLYSVLLKFGIFQQSNLSGIF